MYWCHSHLNFPHPHLWVCVGWRRPALEKLPGERVLPVASVLLPLWLPAGLDPSGQASTALPAPYKRWGERGDLPLPWQWACRDEHFFLRTPIQSLKQCCCLPKVINATRKQSWENKGTRGKLGWYYRPFPTRASSSARRMLFCPFVPGPGTNEIQPPFPQQSSR